MKYPGNETLAEEIRERILNTFRHTLELAEKGDQREAQLGCDFVLRLDPQFEPARQLDERLKGETGAIPVTDLKEIIGEEGGAADSAPVPAGEAAAERDIPALDVLDPVEPAQTPDAEAAAALPDPEAAPSALDSALDLSSLEAAPAAAPSVGADPKPLSTTASGAEPVATLDNESEQRVHDLLAEGQAAFDKAQYQSAIDAWSRIFLIDIDHPEANRRIDLARKLKAEVERKLEETFHDAITKVESGRLDEARSGFRAVLEMMPGHIAAQEYLDRLDAPDFVPPELPELEQPVGAEGLSADSAASEGEFTDDLDGLPEEAHDLPATAEALPRPAIGGVGRASKPSRAPNRTFRSVGLAALVVFAVSGWFLYKNWNTFFPNASETDAPAQLDPITRAKRTYAEAGAAIAVAQLRRLSPGHPQYAEAQALVAQWEASLDANKPNKDAPEPEALAARDLLVNEARIAFQEEKFLLAEELLERGAAHAPLDDNDEELLETSKDSLAAMQVEITMFREGEWEMALRNLWRMKEAGSNTPDVHRLMVDSYFNLGVRDLQRQDIASAIANFQEASELTDNDAEIGRLTEFAEVYEVRSVDLLYRIFVKYLPFR